MSEVTVTLLRLGYLALLWVLVLSAISVLRRDLYGTRIVDRRRANKQVQARTATPPAAAAATQAPEAPPARTPGAPAAAPARAGWS